MGTVSTDTSKFADQLKDIVDAGQEKIEGVRSRLVDGKDMVADRAKNALETVTETIKTHPLKSIGAAFAIGYIGMRLFR